MNFFLMNRSGENGRAGASVWLGGVVIVGVGFNLGRPVDTLYLYHTSTPGGDNPFP